MNPKIYCMLKIDDGYPICIISLSTPLCILVYYDNISLFDPAWHSLRMCDYSVCACFSPRGGGRAEKKKDVAQKKKLDTLL